MAIAATWDSAAANLVYPGLPWGASQSQVWQTLVRRGFRPEPGCLVGVESGWKFMLLSEYDKAGRLDAVTIRFDPATTGEALRLRADLYALMVRRRGRPLTEIEPGRPETTLRDGRHKWLLRYGEPSAAAMWVSREGGAAVVQLDEGGLVWWRFESPDWRPAPDHER